MDLHLIYYIHLFSQLFKMLLFILYWFSIHTSPIKPHMRPPSIPIFNKTPLHPFIYFLLSTHTPIINHKPHPHTPSWTEKTMCCTSQTQALVWREMTWSRTSEQSPNLVQVSSSLRSRMRHPRRKPMIWSGSLESDSTLHSLVCGFVVTLELYLLI